MSDEDQDDPDEDGERWYYFNSKGKKITAIPIRRSMVKTYLFDSDGERCSMAGMHDA
ncbi:MAG: hypothetical protein ACLTS6_07795 [Anaerobutyricum sp.]